MTSSTTPTWQAADGPEIASFLAMPVGFADLLAGLLPDIRNLHHFDFPALIRLMTDRIGGHAGQPLTLILHAGLDRSGAFHHDAHLTNMIVGNPNRVIMLEGKSTLAEIQTELPTLAATYGGGHIDQVMIAGHGNSRAIDLAGTTGVGVDADGRPAVEQHDDTLDLDNNAAATEAFMDALLANMGGPNNRVVFNGCLTASNELTVDPADPRPPEDQIRDQLAANGSLVENMRARAAIHNPTATVIGANASFPEGPDLIPLTGELDIIWADDPALTATNKLDYIRLGIEPTGVLRAVLQEWAPPAAPPQPWLDAVNDRLTRHIDTWDGRIIEAALGDVAAAPGNAGAISVLAQAVAVMAEAQ